jgi:hypothetical protein
MVAPRWIAIALLPITAAAASSGDTYDLKEKCARFAGEVFRREWQTGGSSARRTDGNGSAEATYRNHYNAKLNRCFYLEISTIYPKRSPATLIQRQTLYDIHENKEYGSMFYDSGPLGLTSCYLLDRKCSSSEEWQSFIRPYLEE